MRTKHRLRLLRTHRNRLFPSRVATYRARHGHVGCVIGPFGNAARAKFGKRKPGAYIPRNS